MLIGSLIKSGSLSLIKTGFWQMRFNQNIGLIIYPCPVYLLILPQPLSFLSQPKHSHTYTHRSAFIHSIHLSCPVENLKLSKGLAGVQKWRNLHAKSVVSGAIASDLSSSWHYLHQRSDIRDNFFLAAEGLDYTHSPWHTRKQQFTVGRFFKEHQGVSGL